MVRAKRTDRAEARRRHRAALAAEPELLDATDAEDEPADPAVAVRASRTSQTRPAIAARPSIFQAFRSAFRPVDFKGDLRALPSIALRSKAVWLPILLTVGAAVFYLTSPSSLSFLVFNYFAYIPPVASIFLAGFLAPRASYMTGFIAGLAGAAVFSTVALISAGQPAANGQTVDPAAVQSDLMLAWSVSPISGVLFGAAAGWYRRFLTAANPNRAARAQQRSSDRPRRKGSQQRPLLARKR